MDRQCGIGVLGWRQGTPMWVVDPVRRRNERCRSTGQESDSPSEVSLMEGGVDRGDRNNILVAISDIAYACSIH